MPRDCNSSLKFVARTLLASVSSPPLRRAFPPLLPPDPDDPCPDSEVVFDCDANDHRNFIVASRSAPAH